ALEEEKFDTLPGGIFNKGFVRAYARYLGIDEDQAVADFVAASGGEREQPLPDPPEPRAVTLGQRTDAHPNWRAFVLLVLLFATAVAAVWKLGPSTFHRVAVGLTERFQPKPAPPPAQPRITPPSAPEVSATAPQPAPPAQKKPLARAKAMTVAVSDAATALPAASDAAPAPPEQAPAPTFVVQIRATQDAWVQIVADGKLLSEGVLVPPAEKRVRAAKEVVIKTGNAAGVEVSFNGQALPPLGQENQVATVTLTAGGVRR
ncbi:MAG TPA: RodZ domain-containing protein, partial [Terriglobales bacterium]|nr:RodZ domain-containing protein [Terriglobales bacterium]